jgi:hypothetical protein
MKEIWHISKNLTVQNTSCIFEQKLQIMYENNKVNEKRFHINIDQFALNVDTFIHWRQQL